MLNPQLRKSFGIVQMNRRSSITISKEVRKTLNLADEGDIFEVIVEDGRIVLEPKKSISTDQGWYWTEQWQAEELEAREDLAAGRYKTFNNADDFIKDLMTGSHDED